MMPLPAPSVPFLPASAQAVLAMLGVLPEDDALVLGQSGPLFRPELSASLTAWRIQQAYQALLAVAPWWAACLRDEQAVTQSLTVFAQHPIAPLLHAVLPAWRTSMCAAMKAPNDPSADACPSLELALRCWQQCHDEAMAQLKTGSVAAVAPALTLPVFAPLASTLPMQQPPAHWQPSLAAMASHAGQLAARCLTLSAAATPGQRDLVWQQAGARLYRYPAAPGAPAVLIVYAWINRPDVLDLAPNQSLIAALQAQGLAVWLLDWADTGATGSSLPQYVFEQLAPALEKVCGDSGQPRCALLGICQGGTLALSYAALRAERISSLSLAVTPVDFQQPQDRVAAAARALPISALAAISTHRPAPITLGFLQLKSYSLRLGKYLALLQAPLDDEALRAFLRLEHWLSSGPLLSGPALAEYLERYYHQNGLCRNTLTLSGQSVTLAQLRLPVQLLIADQDHIVPPASSLALTALLSQPVTVERFATGHIGVLVGRQRLALAASVAEFVRQHRTVP